MKQEDFLKKLKGEAGPSFHGLTELFFYIYEDGTIAANDAYGQHLTHEDFKELVAGWSKFYENISPSELEELNSYIARKRRTAWVMDHLSHMKIDTTRPALYYLERTMEGSAENFRYKPRYSRKFTTRQAQSKLNLTPRTTLVHAVEVPDYVWAVRFFDMALDFIARQDKERPGWYILPEEAVEWFKSIDSLDVPTIQKLLVPEGS